MDLTWSGQFQIITDPAYPEVDLVISHLDYLINLPSLGSIFRINLSNQPFKSTFQINLSNQLFKSTYAISLLIKSATPLACGTSLLLTNIRTWESTPIYWGTYDLGSWPSYRSPTRRGVKRITLEHSLVAVWMKALLDTARTSPLCERQLHLQKSQNEENDKGLSSRPVVPEPDEYVGLDLTWSDGETSAGAHLESWGVSRWYKCIKMIQVTRPVGHWELRLRLR